MTLRQAQGIAPAKKSMSSQGLQRFHDMVDDYPNKRSMLMMTLRLVEEEFGCIDGDGIQIAADLCGENTAHVQGMVTFYTHFKQSAHGKHRFMVCATLMCALDGNTDATLKQIQDKLGLAPGERTTDGLFSCEKVECLADCDKPPVVQKDREHFCSMKGKVLDDYIDGLLRQEGKTAEAYRAATPVKMDLRVPVLPNTYGFQGEPVYTTSVPPALKTPLTAPVKDGADMNGSYSNGAKHG